MNNKAKKSNRISKATAPKRKPVGVSKGKADKNTPPSDLRSLIADVRDIIQSARRAAATTINTLQVMTNFEIGRRIVEHEQRGQERAEYGEELLKTLSVELTAEFGRGFSTTNLKLMRRFFLEYSPRIGQTLSDQSDGGPIGRTAPDQFAPALISQTPSGELAPGPDHKQPFALSWSHYVLLLTIKDPAERSFYEIEATMESWSLRKLKRQLASSLYERLALSRDTTAVRKLAVRAARGRPQGAVRPRVPRPRRAGQLLRDRPGTGHHRPPGALPPGARQGLPLRVAAAPLHVRRGPLLRRPVELTLPPDANIHAKEYKLYLPSKELLREKLIEWGRENEGLE